LAWMASYVTIPVLSKSDIEQLIHATNIITTATQKTLKTGVEALAKPAKCIVVSEMFASSVFTHLPRIHPPAHANSVFTCAPTPPAHAISVFTCPGYTHLPRPTQCSPAQDTLTCPRQLLVFTCAPTPPAHAISVFTCPGYTHLPRPTQCSPARPLAVMMMFSCDVCGGL